MAGAVLIITNAMRHQDGERVMFHFARFPDDRSLMLAADLRVERIPGPAVSADSCHLVV